MLIQKLVEYYDVLKDKGFIPLDNYAYRDISALVHLNADGSVARITDCKESHILKLKNGKEKEVKRPVRMLFPAQPDANNSFSYLIEHRPENLFGIAFNKGVFTTDKCKKKRRLFLEKNLPFFAAIENPSPLVTAFMLFMRNWKSEEVIRNMDYVHELFSEFKDISLEKFAFCLAASPENLLQDDLGVKQRWEDLCIVDEAADAESYCPVLNKVAATARLHKKIMRFPGGLASGMTLVSYNNESELSYCKEKSFNSNISQEAVDKYGLVLNYLLSSREHIVDTSNDMVIVFWCENPAEDAERLMQSMLFSTAADMSEAVDSLLLQSIERVQNGLPPVTDSAFADSKFCIAGLAANSARICVKFFYENTFDVLAKNMAKFQAAININPDKLHFISLYSLVQAVKSPAHKKYDIAVMAELYDAILAGRPLPRKLLSQTLNRIVHDHSASVFTDAVRIGIARACFNDYFKGKEVLTLGLDRNNKNPAYLCGRLFACYEAVQKNANDGKKLNRTIKDSSFTAAMRYPARKFAWLNQLYAHHIKKARNAKYFYPIIDEIIDSFDDTIPERFNELQQASFVVGYYHQQKEIYTPKLKNNTDNAEEGVENHE